MVQVDAVTDLAEKDQSAVVEDEFKFKPAAFMIKDQVGYQP